MAEEEQNRELSFIGEKQFQIRRVWNDDHFRDLTKMIKSF
jgi:hypothetical protein